MSGAVPLTADGSLREAGDGRIPLRHAANTNTNANTNANANANADADADADAAAGAEEDRRLLERARGGDRAAFGALVERHHGTLAAVLFQKLGPRAPHEDLLQEVFARALRGIGRFQRRSSFLTWATSIALNLATDWQRTEIRRRRLAPMSSMSDADDVPSPRGERPHGLVETRDEAARAREAMTGLPHHVRLAITLRVVEDVAYDAIAARLNVPVPRVRTWVSRGLRQLRETLAEVSDGHA